MRVANIAKSGSSTFVMGNKCFKEMVVRRPGQAGTAGWQAQPLTDEKPPGCQRDMKSPLCS